MPGVPDAKTEIPLDHATDGAPPGRWALRPRTRQLHALVTPQSHDRSSTEQSRTRPSMMRCANSQQPVMAAPSVEYVKGPLKARKLVPRPISKSSVQRPESRIWNVRAVMAKPLYKTAVTCRPRQRSRRVSELYGGGGDTAGRRGRCRPRAVRGAVGANSRGLPPSPRPAASRHPGGILRGASTWIGAAPRAAAILSTAPGRWCPTSAAADGEIRLSASGLGCYGAGESWRLQ